MSATPESKKDPIAKYRAKFWSSDVSVEHTASTPGKDRVGDLGVLLQAGTLCRL